jgi:hypothetical protein
VDANIPFNLIYDALVDYARQSKGIGLSVVDSEVNVLSENEDGWEKFNQGSMSGAIIASNAFEITRDYRFMGRAIQENKQHFATLEWSLLCYFAALNYDDTLRKLQWNGFKFVRNAQITSFETGETDTETNNTQITAWACVCTISVSMVIPLTMMIAFNNGAIVTEPETV